MTGTPDLSHKHEFAICEMFGDKFKGTVEFAEMPHKPSQARISLSGLEPHKTYRIDFHENGKIGHNCSGAGKEYNPMAELDKNGKQNPY